MKTIRAIYKNGVFCPTTPVELPEGSEVVIELRSAPGESTPRASSNRFDIEKILREQGHKEGIAAILGQWPGDESDEEIERALGEIS